jgi:hypothetical protein
VYVYVLARIGDLACVGLSHCSRANGLKRVHVAEGGDPCGIEGKEDCRSVAEWCTFWNDDSGYVAEQELKLTPQRFAARNGCDRLNW